MATAIGSLDLSTLDGLRKNVTQYFWFESNSSATYGAGVHITLSPEDTFKTNPTGQNILINTDGISIRNGVLPMMVMDNDSLDFNAVDTTQGTYTTMATFGLTGATIGQTSGAHIQISSSGFDVNTNSITNIANFGINGARIGIDEKQRLELSLNGIKGYNDDDVSFFDVSYDAGSTYIDELFIFMLPISTAVSFSDNQPHTITSRQENLELDSWVTSFKLPWMTLSFQRYDTGVVWTGVSDETNVTASIDDDGITVKMSTDEITLTVGTSTTYTASAIISSAVDSIKITLEFTYDADNETVKMIVRGQRMTSDGRTMKISHYRGYYALAIPKIATTAPAFTFGLRGDEALGKYSVRMGKSLDAKYETQMVIGAFNNNQSNTVFEIGNGNYGARSNAFTVDWDGNVVASGDISTSGGISASGNISTVGNISASGTITAQNETPTISITTDTNTPCVLDAYNIRKFGNVVQLQLRCRNTSSTASGQDIYKGTIDTTGLRPLFVTTSGTYYGAYSISGTIGTTGLITVRNANNTAFPAPTGDYYVNISFTYIVA